jgi:FMN-dependent oxidoreductase (nitrilotriacetate monooxygenase family)
MPEPFHLAWFLQGSSAQAWGEPWTGLVGTSWMVPELFTDLARVLERACFDYVLIEDSSYIGESYGASTAIYLENAIAVPRQDPSVIASLMTTVTSRIGIVPTFGTYAYHPYLLARLVATLDQVSSGRIGWNAVTGSSDYAAMNFGLPGMPEHDLRYDIADEYMAAVRALWASWEPGAVIADRESGVLIDPAKVHHANFDGTWFRTRGPLNSGPCPQGQPVIAQAGGSPRGRAFAARHADTIVAHGKGIDGMKAYRDDVRRHMTAQGRDPDSCKVLFMIAPILGETEELAQEHKQLRAARAAAQIAQRLAFLRTPSRHARCRPGPPPGWRPP